MKKMTSFLLASMLLANSTFSTIAFADNNKIGDETKLIQKSSELKKYKSIETSEIKKSLDKPENYKIIVTDKNRNKVYKELGLTDIMKEKRAALPKGVTVKDETFYLENVIDAGNTPTTLSATTEGITTMGTEYEAPLPDYNGLPMKAVYHVEHYYIDEEIIYGGKSFADEAVEKVMSTTLSIGMGFFSPFLWVPDAIFGVSGSWFSTNVTSGKVLTAQVDRVTTTRFIYVKDVDNLYANYDWYPYAGAEYATFSTEFQFHYMDQNYLVDRIYGYRDDFKQSQNYQNNTFLQDKAYGTYKGLPGYIEYFEHVPNPDIPNFD